jgi:hypothetical protein
LAKAAQRKIGEHRLPACWFESVAIASRALRRRRAENDLLFFLPCHDSLKVVTDADTHTLHHRWM